VYTRDKDYIVNGEDVMIVDEHTGRALAGRRYSDGLHQALEAKEGVKIQQESKTLASIIKTLHKSGQPILVGTVSVEKSEYLSERLTQANIPHNVLNAKQHEREAEVVGAAWQKWAVTIATNMAGRGTDIKLWAGVKDLGGLIILGTEKHETRRIDNQLRGRAGRQGDPGMTQFLISPNDDIMRIFGGDKLFGVFNSPMFAALPDNEPLTQSWILTRKVTGVQKQVEW